MDKRTAEWHTVAGLMEAQEAVDEPTSVDYQTDPRCHVCSAPDRALPNGWGVRNLVDELLLVPKPYATILNLIEPLTADWPEDARISRFSLMRHARNHLGWERAAARRIAERNAQRDARIEEVSERMLVAQSVLEAIEQRGYEALVSGEITPSVRDTMIAATTLREIEREAGGQRTVAEAFAQLDRVIQVIREEIPQERWEHVLSRLEEDRPLSADSGSDAAWDDLVAEMGEDAYR